MIPTIIIRELALVVLAINAMAAAGELVTFELHTRNNGLSSFDRLYSDGPANTVFDATRPTRIFVHGYMSDRQTFLDHAKAFLKKRDCNFIAVNWVDASNNLNYAEVKDQVEEIATDLARLIDRLVNESRLQLSQLMLIGHSLGAHVAGAAGERVSAGKLAIIIGLDPADPLYDESMVQNRLSPHDANYVQVIHTNGDLFGIEYPMGHADFYPNWGNEQRGCETENIFSFLETDICSHSRANELYIESLSEHALFESAQCDSYQDILENNCRSSGRQSALMGTDDPDVLVKARGIYYLKTNAKSPYSERQTGEIEREFGKRK